MISIDYSHLVKAAEWFSKNQYKRLETPWIVNQMRDKATRTKVSTPHKALMPDGYDVSIDGCLSSTGESSLAMAVDDGTMIEGLSYFTIAPCFISADAIGKDELSQFMALEVGAYSKDMNIARTLLGTITRDVQNMYKEVYDININTSFDAKSKASIMLYNDVEIGLFGVRNKPYLPYKWAYCTGMRLPQFQIALGKATS